MKTEIETKINIIFTEEINDLDEFKVVYLLSRIRKRLEFDNLGNKYKFLKLYCDWVLHCQINNTDLLKTFKIFQDGKLQEQEVLFMGHGQFFSELNKFSNEIFHKIYLHNLDERNIFSIILDEILKDTPLIFCKKDKYQTILKKEGNNRFWHTSVIEN